MIVYTMSNAKRRNAFFTANCQFVSEEDWNKMKANEPEIRQAEFLAVGETCEAINYSDLLLAQKR